MSVSTFHFAIECLSSKVAYDFYISLVKQSLDRLES